MKFLNIAMLFFSFFLLASCGNMQTTKSGSVDYQMFAKPDEVNKWYGEALKKFGENAKVAEEFKMYISRPSVEGMIRKEGRPDELNMSLSYQAPSNKNQVHEIDYWSESGGWQAGSNRDIRVIGGNVEDYKLEDDLFDISAVTPDMLNTVIKAALTKYQDAAKYKYQYVSNISVDKAGIEISIKGKLASNDQEKSEYYKTDLKGNAK